MPTMAQYAASGGYAKDAAVSRNLNNGGSVSTGGSSSKKKTPTPQIPTMMDAAAYAQLPSSIAAEKAGLAYQNTMTPPAAGGYMNVPTYGGTPATPTPGVQQAQPMFNMPVVPKVPMPPVRDLNAITQYAEGQIKSKLDAATGARDLATNNLQTQAQQLQQQLSDQRTAQANRLAATRDQALKGLQTGYTQAQGALTDQRNLQNVAFQRKNDPYSGATDYKNAMLGREREITDRNNNQLYTNQIGSLEQDYSNNTAQLDQDIASRTAKIQQDLQMNQANVQKAWQDVANAAPAEKERLIKEAQDSERNYQLALRNADRDDVLAQLTAKRTEMEGTRLNADLANMDRTYALDEKRFDQGAYQFDKTESRLDKNADRDFSIGVGNLTGSFTNPTVQGIAQQILQLKQAAESGDPADMQLYKQKADQLRNQLATMGVDPNTMGLGFDSDYKQALKGVSGANFSQRTIAGQNQDIQRDELKYAKEQDAIKNTAQYAGMYQGQPTMQKIMQDATIKNMTADNARQAATEARETGNNQLAKRFEIWDRTGKAPAGIPGVAEGTPLGGKKSDEKTAESYSKYVDGVAKYDSDKVLTNPQQVEDSILLSGLSDYEQYRLYAKYGIKWDDPIPKAPGK